MIVYKGLAGIISVVEKSCKNQLNLIEVHLVRTLGHFMLSLKKNPDLPCVISDKVINVNT